MADSSMHHSTQQVNDEEWVSMREVRDSAVCPCHLIFWDITDCEHLLVLSIVLVLNHVYFSYLLAIHNKPMSSSWTQPKKLWFFFFPSTEVIQPKLEYFRDSSFVCNGIPSQGMFTLYIDLTILLFCIFQVLNKNLWNEWVDK